MEQGRRPERVLRPKLGRASAGIVLALASMAALAVCGCGDSSSDSQTASAPASQGEQAEAGGAARAPAPQAGSPGSKPPAPSPNPVPGSGQGASPRQGKQGSTVTVPSGEQERGITPQQRAKATVLSMEVDSPSLQPASTGGVAMLPATYTCDGKDTWPELTWRGVPAGTAELALYVMNLRPVGGELFYDWTVAGLDPSLTGIPSGRLPKGAVEGRNSSGKVGYSVCPAKGSSETFLFALYALPEPLSVRRGFDPNAVRREIAQQAGNSGVMAAGYRR